MTKREFLDTVFALAPNEANAIMDAFDEYVDSNEPHWIPVTERLPEKFEYYLVSGINSVWFARYENGRFFGILSGHALDTVIAWMPLPEPYKGGGDGMRYCKIKGKLCVFATEYGYCSFTVCREVTT